MFRTLMLVFCFATGWFFPSLALLKPLMPLCLIYMLTIVFMRMDFTQRAFSWRQLIVIGVNIASAFCFWKGLLWCGAPEGYAQAAFFTAITPTATAAPVIISLLGGSIGFAVVGFVLSALIISLVLPIAVPLVLHQSAWTAMPLVLSRVCFVTLLPALLAFGLRFTFKARAQQWAKRLTPSTLYAWMALVAIIAASASHFLDTDGAHFSRVVIGWVLVIDIGIGIFSFGVGALLGLRGHVRECSQLLGQKNTSYTTYLAFACDAPFAALGPAFYVFFHNAWNGLQLIFHKEK
jgi:BASS family bile acid:Na+ symporter